jgi:hypothetical protein
MEPELLLKLSTVVVPLFIVICIFAYKNRWGRADLLDAFVYDECVATTASVSHKARRGWYRRTRMKSFNAQTGGTQQRKNLSAEYEVLVVVNGVIWMEVKQRDFTRAKWHVLRAFHMITLRELTNLDKLKRQFGMSWRARLNDVVIKDARIKLTGADGFKHELDCRTMTVHGASQKVQLPVDLESFSARQLAPFKFVKMKNADRYEVWFEDKKSGEGKSFIDPRCLYLANNHIFFSYAEQLNKGSAVFIMAMRSDGEVTVQPVRIAGDGSSTPEICFAGETGTRLIFVTKYARKGIVFAVDKATAGLAWKKRI